MLQDWLMSLDVSKNKLKTWDSWYKDWQDFFRWLWLWLSPLYWFMKNNCTQPPPANTVVPSYAAMDLGPLSGSAGGKEGAADLEIGPASQIRLAQGPWLSADSTSGEAGHGSSASASGVGTYYTNQMAP